MSLVDEFKKIDEVQLKQHKSSYDLGWTTGFEEMRMIVEAYAKSKNNNELIDFLSTIKRKVAAE